VIPDGRYGIFNTSLCQAGDEFVLMFEIDRPPEEAGAAFEARYSRFIADSLISRINQAAGLHWVEVDPETEIQRIRDGK